MPALKKIGNIGSRLNNSPISQSPLWHMPVGSITPVQLVSFRTRMAMNGRVEEADDNIRIALDEVMNAVCRGVNSKRTLYGR